MKVLLFQVFDRQKVIQIDEEPIHICGSGQGSNLFLVCLKSGKINIYSAASEVPLIYSFSTHNENVISLAYSQEYGIVATIEPEDAQSAIHVARIYRLPLTKDLEPYCIHTQKGEEDEDFDGDDKVQIYQLPLHASVNAITICPKTGRIAVATSTDISVWNPIGAGEYEKMFQIETHSVQNIAIHGSYLAYCTERTVSIFECMVVSLDEEIESKEEKMPMVRLHNGPSPVTTSDFTVTMTSRGNSISTSVTIPCVSFSTESKTNAQKSDRSRVKFGPISDVSTVMKVESRYTVKTFHLLINAKYSSELGPIHTLFFLPEYSHIVRDEELILSTETPAYEFTQLEEESEVGMRCFVSTRMEGKLYNICEPSELATYAYTSPTFQCCANDEFLYAVTDAEVDAFTLRTSLSAAEYEPIPPCLMGMKNFLGPCRILSPGSFVVLLSKIKASETTALLARFRSPTKRTPMRPKRRLPRIGVVEAEEIENDPNVDWNDGEETNWIMYSMHPYSLHMLYDDIIERSLTTVSLSTSGSSSVDGADSLGYYQLVLEGHFLLQSKIVALKRRFRREGTTKELRDKVVLDIKAYTSLLRHSSGVLGDYFFRATKEYHKAAQCYSDSDRKISSIVSMFLDREESRDALVEYLDRVLFDIRMENYSDETTQLSDTILVYYAEYAPHRLSTVVIDSFIKRYTKTTALALLCLAPSLIYLTPSERRAKISSLEKYGYSLTSLSSGALLVTPKDAMACVLAQLSLGMKDQSVRMLKRMDPSHIVDFCTSYPQFLRAETPEKVQASPLIGALRDAAPLALLEAAVKLGGDSVHLSVFDAIAAVSTRKVLRIFCLEHKLVPHEQERITESVVHLSDGMHKRYKVASLPSMECAAELADLYLDMALEGRACLSYDELRTSGSNDSSECFYKWLEQHQKVFVKSSPRWLNELFNFVCRSVQDEVRSSGPDNDAGNDDVDGISNDEDKNQTVATREINIFYVRKLVGLLCSGLIRDPVNLVERLHRAAIAESTEATAVGAKNRKMLDVVLALAGPLAASKRTFSELVFIAPGAALDFGMSFCTEPSDWKAVLDALLCCSNRKDGDIKADVVVDVYEKVLEYTALMYEPDVFLGLLPSDGNLLFFKRYIELSFQKNDNENVKIEFMSLLQSIENGIRLL